MVVACRVMSKNEHQSEIPTSNGTSKVDLDPEIRTFPVKVGSSKIRAWTVIQLESSVLA